RPLLKRSLEKGFGCTGAKPGVSGFYAYGPNIRPRCPVDFDVRQKFSVGGKRPRNLRIFALGHDLRAAGSASVDREDASSRSENQTPAVRSPNGVAEAASKSKTHHGAALQIVYPDVPAQGERQFVAIG